MQTCLTKNCQVITIKETYHLGNDLQSQVLAFAFGLAAQIERDLISQRTKCSLASKKEQGIKLGRPLGATARKLKLAKNIALSIVWELLKVDYSTIYKFLKTQAA